MAKQNICIQNVIETDSLTTGKPVEGALIPGFIPQDPIVPLQDVIGEHQTSYLTGTVSTTTANVPVYHPSTLTLGPGVWILGCHIQAGLDSTATGAGGSILAWFGVVDSNLTNVTDLQFADADRLDTSVLVRNRNAYTSQTVVQLSAPETYQAYVVAGLNSTGLIASHSVPAHPALANTSRLWATRIA